MKSFWVIVSAFFFAVMGVFVKFGMSHFSSAELVFYRSAIGIVVTTVMMWAMSIEFATPLWKEHVARGLTGCLSLILYFYAIGRLPLAVAVTLNHTAPLFFAIIAWLYYKESPSGLAVAAIAIGFAGVALLVRFSPFGLQLDGFLAGLLAGFTCAILYLFIRKLGQLGEPEPRTVFYYTLVCTAGAAAWIGVSGMHPVTLGNSWILVGVGGSATVAQLALTRAYKTGKSLLTTTLTYLNVLFAGGFGVVFWGEIPSSLTWLAFFLIIASGVLATMASGRSAAPIAVPQQAPEQA